jgi:predicted site-specific integrase-resolvase
MRYTLGQAAKATGINKMTIGRAIRSGKISAAKNQNGEYDIDPSELHRVFPPVSQSDVTKSEHVTIRYPDSDMLLQRVKELEIRLESAHERISDRDKSISEIRKERDDWKEQAQRLLLTHSPEASRKPAEASHGFLARVMSKKS